MVITQSCFHGLAVRLSESRVTIFIFFRKEVLPSTVDKHPHEDRPRSPCGFTPAISCFSPYILYPFLKYPRADLETDRALKGEGIHPFQRHAISARRSFYPGGISFYKKYALPVLSNRTESLSPGTPFFQICIRFFREFFKFLFRLITSSTTARHTAAAIATKDHSSFTVPVK